MLGIGTGLLIFYLPMLLHLVFIGALGILFKKVRSPATGMLFFGSIITLAGPWLASIFHAPQAYSNIPIQLVSALGVLLQTVGVVAYVRSVSVPSPVPR